MKLEKTYNDTQLQDWENSNYAQDWKKGKWSDGQRIFAVQKGEKGEILVLKLSIFDRLKRYLLKIICLDYFKIMLKDKNIQVLSPEKIGHIVKKTNEQATQQFQTKKDLKGLSKQKIQSNPSQTQTSVKKAEVIQEQPANQPITKPISESDQFKQKLKSINKQDYEPRLHDFIEMTLKEVETQYEYRLSSGERKAFTLNFFDNASYVTFREDRHKVLDDFIKKGIIAGWIPTARGEQVPLVKLLESDEFSGLVSGQWRTLDVIQKEDAFKENNQINVSPEDVEKLKAFCSRPNKKREDHQDIDNLLHELNKRTAPGKYDWKTDIRFMDVEKILKFLKDKNYIHSFKVDSYSNSIFVKKEDEGVKRS